MITLHAFGMAIMVGLSLAIDLRLLVQRVFTLPRSFLRHQVADWHQYPVRAPLFSMQATTYITD